MDVGVDVSGLRIETERLVLRAFEEGDLGDFFEYASVPGVGEMAGWPHHETVDTSREILELFICGGENFALFHKGDGKVIGSLGFKKSWTEEDERFRALRSTEIGYVLAKDYWGQGLVPEAVKAVIAHGFGSWGIEIFGIMHFVENGQSRRVIEKCGFKFVGRGRYHAKLLDKDFDDMRYVLLRGDLSLPSAAQL